MSLLAYIYDKKQEMILKGSKPNMLIISNYANNMLIREFGPHARHDVVKTSISGFLTELFDMKVVVDPMFPKSKGLMMKYVPILGLTFELKDTLE